MDDALLVRGIQGLGDLTRDRQGVFQRNRATSDPIGQGVALDQLEDQRVGLAAVLESINRRDVWMVERRQHLRLPAEAGEALRLQRECRSNHFQRDVAIELGIARAIHLAHAAGAERGENLIRAEARAGSEGHSCFVDYRGPATAPTALLLSNAALSINPHPAGVGWPTYPLTRLRSRLLRRRGVTMAVDGAAGAAAIQASRRAAASRCMVSSTIAYRR